MTLPAILEQFGDLLKRELRVALPGRVVSYDQATQTATIALQLQLPVDRVDARGQRQRGEHDYEELPELESVPIGYPRGGGAFVWFPLDAGDHVWVMFADQSLDDFIRTGTVAKPQDIGSHELYPYAIPVGDPSESGRAINIPDDGGTAPKVVAGVEGRSSVVVFGQNNGDEVWLGDESGGFVALASLVLTELQAIKTAFDEHVHTGVTTGGGSSGVPASPMGSPSSVASTKVKARS